jgi:flavin reductase (DIM6/NTAB) family NADH-FMN oxidoreductase RutF
MRYDLETAPPGTGYKLLASTVTPRPIAWVSTRSRDGVVNAAPFSFFNVMGGDPPTLALGIAKRSGGGYKDTAQNIVDTGEFVVNLVTDALAAAMNLTAVDAPPDVNELELAGLETAPSAHIAAPRIAASPVSFECVTLQVVSTGPSQAIVIGRVVAVHVADAFVLDAARAHIDTPALHLIARMHGGGWYARNPEMFEMPRPAWPDRPVPPPARD